MMPEDAACSFSSTPACYAFKATKPWSFTPQLPWTLCHLLATAAFWSILDRIGSAICEL